MALLMQLQCSTWPGLACSCWAWPGQVWSGLACSGMVWFDWVWSGMAWSDLVWSGLVCLSVVWYAQVWPDLVCPHHSSKAPLKTLLSTLCLDRDKTLQSVNTWVLCVWVCHYRQDLCSLLTRTPPPTHTHTHTHTGKACANKLLLFC